MFATKERSATHSSREAIAHTIHGKHPIQTKLTIGPSSDKYETEADRVADKVVRREPAIQKKCVACEGDEAQKRPLIQRMEEDEAQPKLLSIQKQDEEDDVQPKLTPGIQRMGEEDDVQPKSVQQAKRREAAPWVSQKVNQTRGTGRGMPNATRSFMETGFGRDFSGVKIHNDSISHQLNRRLNAQAFTVGNDIYFGQGKYNPASNAGKHLLAHELTHTVQQTGGVRRSTKFPAL